MTLNDDIEGDDENEFRDDESADQKMLALRPCVFGVEFSVIKSP